MQFSIAVETLVRLADLIAPIADQLEPEFRCIRLDNGQLVATDCRLMSIENVGPKFEGVAYIVPEPALIAQCRSEIAFGSNVTLSVTPAIAYASAKTSLGYTSGNILYVHPGTSRFDRWREVVKQGATKGVALNQGGMFWDTEWIARLGKSSPSGKLVFPENIDITQPALIRDANDYDWLGCFNPAALQGAPTPPPATLPEWMK